LRKTQLRINDNYLTLHQLERRQAMTLLTTTEVAKILRVAPNTVRRFIKTGTLPAIAVGAQKRIDSESLIRFLKQGEEHAITHDTNR
jgi:excisionase family DNA binding protein